MPRSRVDYVCMCCRSPMVADKKPMVVDGDVASFRQETGYWFCNQRSCTRFRLLVVTEA
jgi:hypothetical protein